MSDLDCPTRPRKREMPPPQAFRDLHRRRAEPDCPTPPQALPRLPRRRAEPRLHVTFICTGNICRSPMAEKMFAHQISQRGLGDVVRVTSAGIGCWHVGKCADERASRVLQSHGYPTEHSAAQVNPGHLTADLVVALGRNHVGWLRQYGVDPSRIRMLRSFDPRSGAYALDVADPYYGDHDDFEEILAIIEAALPGLHNWVDERLAGNGQR